MKNIVILTLTFTLFFGVNIASSADTFKTITLADGSMIKGKVVKFENSIYTIKTKNLGVVDISDADIVSITNTSASLQENTSDLTLSPQELKGHVASLQGNFLNDPAMMEELKKMMSDPSIVNIVSDPNFMNTIMTYDQEKIKNDPRTQQLMDNPKIQKLMQKMQNKMGK